jgi:hypothetical protein
MKSIEKVGFKDLEKVEVTTGRNGYPSNIYTAYSCSNIENFEEVKTLAAEKNKNIILLHRRDGWALWESKGTVLNGIQVRASDFGDDYSEIYCQSEFEFFEDEVRPYLEDFENFEEINNFLAMKKVLFDEVDLLEEDEVVIALEGRYFEKYKQECLSFSHDTHNFIIALTD